MTLELRCTRDLALWLGAISPMDVNHHKQLRAAGYMLVRSHGTGWPMFWPVMLTRADLLGERSS